VSGRRRKKQQLEDECLILGLAMGLIIFDEIITDQSEEDFYEDHDEEDFEGASGC